MENPAPYSVSNAYPVYSGAKKKHRKAGPFVFTACLVMGIFIALAIPMLVGGAAAPVSSKSSAVSSAPQQVASYATLEEASAALPFEPSTPQSLPEGHALQAVRLLDGDILELEYGTGKSVVLFRTALGNEDLSGDYTEYAFTLTEEVAGVARSYAGVAEQKLNLAVWANRNQSYAIVCEEGLDAALMRQYAENIA